MQTKPPPPAPLHIKTTIKPGVVTSFKQTTYKLPMSGENQPAWVKVLRDAGKPDTVIVLDFESYFETGEDSYSMHHMTTYEYIQDTRWEVLGLAHVTMHGSAPFADYESNAVMEVGEAAVAAHLKYLQYTYGKNLEQCTVVVQNAGFDANVLALRYGIHPRHIIDVLGLARMWQARANNDLDAMCKRWGLPPKGNTSDFAFATFRKRMYTPSSRKKGPKMPSQRPLMTADQIKNLCEYARNDAKREWEIFTILLPKLSNPRFELRVMQHTLEMATKPVLGCDQELASSLAAQMDAKVDEVCRLAGQTRDVISGNKTFTDLMVTALQAAGENPMSYFKVCKPTKSQIAAGENGYKLADAKDDPERKLMLEHSDPTVRVLMTARTQIKSWPAHSERVRRIARIAAACHGVMPIPLKYWGAHTGRWSGAELINMQNLPRQGDPLVVAIKGLILAMFGYKLVIVDAAAIEARVLAWIAGQDDLVDLFRSGADVYCDMASTMAGMKIRKAKKTDIPAIADRYTSWRQRGKVVILGSGYGMGADNMLEFAAGQGVIMQPEEAKAAIDSYRKKNTQIVKFWRDIERAFVYTAKYKRPSSLPRGMTFHSTEDCDVIITLPNGRELKYHKIKLSQGKYSEQASVYNEMEHKWEYLWGGVLTENVVQAMSRDILIEAGMRCEDQGYHIAHHVHDELIGHVLEADAAKALTVFVKELSVVPPWAPGIALNAEGVISDRYGKH